MEETNMLDLLLADEETLRRTLQANRSVDKSRQAAAETLREELGTMLLRYNAACAKDPARQAVADGMTATLRDALDLLLAGEVEKETPPRRVSSQAVALFFGAILLGLAGVLLIKAVPVAAYILLAGMLLCGFLAGLRWFPSREAKVRAVVDADAAWYAMKKSVETMDRKIEEYAAAEQTRSGKQAPGQGAAPDREELALFGDLLEALYAGNGAFALRQLGKLPAYLEKRGVTIADYDEETAEFFELLPSKNQAMTQRPALLAGEKLLLSGKATEQIR